MKKLSGQLIARLVHVLRRANESEMDKATLIKLITDTINSEEMYCDLPEGERAAPEGSHPRIENLDQGSIETMNVMLPWSSYFVVNGNKIIGSAWTKTKRNNAQPFPDKGVEKLAKLVDMSGLTVFEVGCYEGHHTVTLARHARHVAAVDGRIENVLKTMVRIWATKLENKASSSLINLEQGNLKSQLKNAGLEKQFDLIHHRGVLYHLSDPVDNILQCAAICRRFLYLHTQIASDEAATNTVERDGKKYSFYKYKEPKVEFSPFAGICEYALWLSRNSLLELLQNAGFKKISIISEVQERHGPRIEILAEK